ncbi:glycosyltransferase family 2 protein [Candidatus Dojkabacteria bacterium]|jgi:hypothetical protein|nr:glycosyltransferase family 2 protein [Candidatus Dojkabacteria bacterium]
MKVAVVTPTVCSEHLKQCIDSVQNQNYTDLAHYIFIDGEQFDLQVKDMIFLAQRKRDRKEVNTVSLSDNIGSGWYGHRVYASCSFLVNADIICYLDEDNWLDPNHVESVVECINKGYDWVYSLRNVINKEGNFLCKDDCESLGKWPVFFDSSVNHIDTSCFAIRRDVAVGIGHAWYGQWGADRQFYGALKKYYPNYECTKEYTLNYRLDGNPNSVKEDFFINGNNNSYRKYAGLYPWRLNDK